MKLSIVVPVYKEEGNLPIFLSRTLPVLQKITPDYEILFALDPSPDKTADLILEANRTDSRVKLLEFSRRFGQPMATLAGMQYATGDAVIVIDVDLQDPPELIEPMVKKWQEGYDVVYAQRTRRDGLGLIYRIITGFGYFLIKRSADVGVNIPENVGDFRLMSRRVVDEVVKLKESHGFLRGLVAVVGFRQTSVQFDRPPRLHGQSNYNPFFGSLRIGLNGLICFSTGLLKATALFGMALTSLSIVLALFFTVMKRNGIPLPLGNPGLASLVLFLGGIQLLSVGILGEYIARIYDEVKQRPRFIVSRSKGFEHDLP